jgi:hypothetical protein
MECPTRKGVFPPITEKFRIYDPRRHWWHRDMGIDPRGTEGLVFSEVRYYSDGPLVGPGWVASPRGLRWRLGESRITARRPNVSTRVKGHL